MAKQIDTAGMWTIKANPITHDGVALYSGKAIDASGEYGLDPNKLYPVLRSFEELTRAAESFNGKPLINNHEMIGTAEDLTKPDEKNIGGTIFNVRPSETQEGYIVADMTLFSEEIQTLVREGKVELSLGYWCKYRPEKGVYKGQRYEFVQYDLEGNHIALVECGRMGSGVRVFDQREKTLVYDSMEITEMKNAKTLDADELRAEIAGLLKDASDEALAKCKDLLDPEKKTGDEDDPKKTGDDEPEKTDEPKKPEGDEGDDPKKDGEDDDEPKKTDDGDDEPEKGEGDDEDEPKKEGDEDEPKKTGEDSAPLKAMLAEFAKREKLYKAVEPHTGAFDHDDMTAAEVAKYAAGKLGVACVDGAEVAVVESYLKGLGVASAPKISTSAQDASTGVEDRPSAALIKFLG